MIRGTRVGGWLEHRTGLIGAVRRFLDEAIPSSVGWRNTLGSLAGALIAVQLVSGFLLALYYVPHPEAAYESLRYIEERIAGGALVRALHYWGASFIIVAVFLHLGRVFFCGAYKPPREATWLAGVALFLVVLGLAFTGQLLAWNQMGYWSASVGIEIASSTPVLGSAIRQLLVGGQSLGALTLTRFYALHVVLLPVLLCLLVLAHLHLLRRHGPARPDSDRPNGVRPFHPFQTVRDGLVISAALAGLVVLASMIGGPDGPPADPSDSSFVPRPEWYFQSHYQVLRFTPGAFRIVATVGLPTLCMLVLAGLPWLDRAPGTSFRQRRTVVVAGILVMSGLISLTLIGILTNLPTDSNSAAESDYNAIAAGRAVYIREECRDCHTIGMEGDADEGPDLTSVGLRLKPEYMLRFLMNPQAFWPETKMPPPKVTTRELDALVAYLQSLIEEPGF